ncbi:MAG TPA: M35 family metallo-endopeptidase [Burkholderiales bacterium]|nr:M35 family metallo-endopeptidase [Burkholderiales bacterium]
MAYQTKDLYSTRHAAMIEILKDKGFASSDDWKSVIEDARRIVISEGFDVDRYRACEAIRKRVDAAEKKSRTKPAATLLTAAGVTSLPSTGSKEIPATVVKRVAVLDSLRHLWLLKKSGSHKLWVLSLPEGYRDWPEADLAGKDYAGISNRLDDKTAHFSTEDRKHLSEATQHGLKWVHKAMEVAASPKKTKNMTIIKRWFADSTSTDEDMLKAAAALNAGLKKIAGRIRSTFMLIVDMPLDRGNKDRARVNAFVFSNEKIDAIYVEPAFFSDRDMFKGLKNWTRIVVHELTHREVKTQDHRYRHHTAGLKPDSGDANFNAAKALDNADSWAMFCMDCAGEMTESDYAKVKVA